MRQVVADRENDDREHQRELGVANQRDGDDDQQTEDQQFSVEAAQAGDAVRKVGGDAHQRHDAQ